MPQPDRHEAICREAGRSSAPQRPDSARTMGPEGWVAPPILPGPAAAARISKAALCFERDLVPRVPGRRREEGHRWEAVSSSAPLAGVPRGLGLGRMVHTWVAASASLGSQVCPGAQVSFLGGRGTLACGMPEAVVGPLKA